MGLESRGHSHAKKSVVSRRNVPDPLPLTEGFDWGANTTPVKSADVDRTRSLLDTESGLGAADFIPGARAARRATKAGGRRVMGEPVTTTIDADELKRLIASPIKDIPWRLASSEALREIIEAVARQAGVPLSLLEGKDFMSEIDELGGRNLQGLFVYGQRLEDETEKTAMGRLFKKAEIKTRLDDLTQAKQVKREIHWDQIQSETIRQLLRHIAKKRKKRISQLSKIDLEQEYPNLGGIRIDGLYYNALRDENRGDQDPMKYLLSKVGFTFSRTNYENVKNRQKDADFTVDDIVQKIQSGENIYWTGVSESALRGLLEKVAEERNAPISLLVKTDFYKRFAFLNGKNLRRFYLFVFENDERKNRGLSIVEYLNEKTGVTIETEDVIKSISLNRKIPWKLISDKILRDLLDTAADELHIPTVLLTSNDLTKKSYKFLEDHTLERVYATIISRQVANEHETIIGTFMKRLNIDVGIPVRRHSRQITNFREVLKGDVTPGIKRSIVDFVEFDVIKNIFRNFFDEVGKEKTVFTSNMRKQLMDLPDIQQKLLIELFIGKRTFEEIATEVNRNLSAFGFTEKVDVKTLRDHYNDAIIALALKLFFPV